MRKKGPSSASTPAAIAFVSPDWKKGMTVPVRQPGQLSPKPNASQFFASAVARKVSVISSTEWKFTESSRIRVSYSSRHVNEEATFFGGGTVEYDLIEILASTANGTIVAVRGIGLNAEKPPLVIKLASRRQASFHLLSLGLPFGQICADFHVRFTLAQILKEYSLLSYRLFCQVRGERCWMFTSLE